MHGGVAKTELSKENLEALEKGFENLKVHIENIRKFGVESVVAVNKFLTDTDAEISLLKKLCSDFGAKAVLSEGYEKGGDGTKELAETVCEIANSGNSDFKPLYELEQPLAEKIKILAKEIYRADHVEFDSSALKKLKSFEEAGYGNLPVCMAKTQNSISHDKVAFGAPKGYVFPVRDVQLYSGAGFVVAFAGEIVPMPGLPKLPAAMNIDVDDLNIDNLTQELLTKFQQMYGQVNQAIFELTSEQVVDWTTEATNALVTQDEAMKDYISTVANVTEKQEILNAAYSEMKEKGELSVATVQKLIEQEPSLVSALTVENGHIRINIDSLQDLSNGYFNTAIETKKQQITQTQSVIDETKKRIEAINQEMIALGKLIKKRIEAGEHRLQLSGLLTACRRSKSGEKSDQKVRLQCRR